MQEGQVWQVQVGRVQQQVLLPDDAYVASMQLQQPEPVELGFMCGSLPVPTLDPTDQSSQAAALVPVPIGLQSQRASAAPRYRVLPTQTDLNMPPSSSFQAEPNFPVPSSHEAAAWAGSYLCQPLARKCEALAVNALAGYGDDIDVVAPVDILKQLFKMPYSKARLSLAVHRIGRTLILNCGPDEWRREERPGGKLGSQKKSRAQMMERTLFSKFVQHSVNGHSCDSASPPDSVSQSSSGNVGFEELDDHELQQRATPRMAAHHKGKHGVSLGHYRRSRSGGGFETVQKKRYVGEQQRETEFDQKECPAEGPQRPPSDTYLRVLFWQFQNLRMLLGSDLLLFSNEDHSAVSLHLLEIERQVTPLMWLDAWLDNVMASIPELAVCYHRNGVVQGYELLKTDDIFLLKGLAEDGTAFFNPQVVQKNASTVLRFLQDNCKQDPGTYWLLKNAGEDLMQLFDLSVISKTCSTRPQKDEQSGGTLPSTRSNCNEQYSLPLAMLLYRLTHRLSQSQDPADRRKCAKLFGKCLEFMEEQEHLIIRASAHEHAARLILTSFKEIGSMLKPLLLESSTAEADAGTQMEQSLLKLPCSLKDPVGDEVISSCNEILECHKKEVSSFCSCVEPSSQKALSLGALIPEAEVEGTSSLSKTSVEARTSMPEGLSALSADNAVSSRNDFVNSYTHLAADVAPTSAAEPHNVLGFLSDAKVSPKSLLVLTDPVSSRLAAVHYISQAIKALRWQRQLDVVDHPPRLQSTLPKQPSHNQQFPLCICGEVECVAICDFREIGIGAQMDQKLWRLMLLLGEAYLALGQAYKDDAQLGRALKAAELACLVCGSMPQVSDSATVSSHTEIDFHSWDNFNISSQKNIGGTDDGSLRPSQGKLFQVKDGDWSCTTVVVYQQGLFWGCIWTFVGDVYVEIQRSLGKGDVLSHTYGSQVEELTMTQEVMKEVKRLKKKIGQFRGGCEMCSLTSCSCQSDRASSGDSASSCNSSTVNTKFGRKHNKKTSCKSHDKVNGDNFIESKSAEGEDGRRANVDDSDSTRHTNNDGLEKIDTVPGEDGQKKNVDYSISTGRINNEGHKKIDLVPGEDFNVCATASKLLTSQTVKENVQVTDCSNPNDIFSYLRRPVMGDWEANLSAAVECYSTAVLAFSGLPECLPDLERTLRKKGWACNELGRMRLAHGQIKLAEAAFATAIEAFRDVKDPVNVVLVQCNLGHGQRAAAEALAEKLSAWEDCDFRTLFVQTIAEAKFLYGEALKFYGMGRQELLGAKDSAGQSMGGLWNEVHTQLAHTYLRLGMLLAREDNFVHSCQTKSPERRLSGNESRDRLSRIKDASPTKDAITKALEIYKSLGSLRTQEAAFAQYQLACHHRDLCRMQADDIVLKKVETSSFQKAKLHASLAELYWQKALDYYHPEGHAEIFLDIMMERSALCLKMATSFHQNQMMEQALSLLLEGRRAFVSEAINCSVKDVESPRVDMPHARPSAKLIGNLTRQVQLLLKNMLANALMLKRPSSNASSMSKPGPGKNIDSAGHGDMRGGAMRVDDVVKLRQMYRLALKSEEEPDLELLFNLWVR